MPASVLPAHFGAQRRAFQLTGGLKVVTETFAGTAGSAVQSVTLTHEVAMFIAIEYRLSASEVIGGTAWTPISLDQEVTEDLELAAGKYCYNTTTRQLKFVTSAPMTKLSSNALYNRNIRVTYLAHDVGSSSGTPWYVEPTKTFIEIMTKARGSQAAANIVPKLGTGDGETVTVGHFEYDQKQKLLVYAAAVGSTGVAVGTSWIQALQIIASLGKKVFIHKALVSLSSAGRYRITLADTGTTGGGTITPTRIAGNVTLAACTVLGGETPFTAGTPGNLVRSDRTLADYSIPVLENFWLDVSEILTFWFVSDTPNRRAFVSVLFSEHAV